MFEHFRDGGFGMYPTLVFGVLLLAAAVRYAKTPETRFVPLLVSLGALTMAAGSFGFVSGLIATARNLNEMPTRDPYIPFMGMAEALNCVAFALLFVVTATIGTSLGALRAARQHGDPAVK